ncbi:hypothetical protein [Amycolatopsis samaneae]|uniref:Uncharacterized protein n=1 Tax=Amycolatopsis samaneae TaxID=664691 RepID=A0ABW5GEH3_9PSEU
MTPKIYKTDSIDGAEIGQYESMVLSTIAIPDPGYPYQLTFSGQAWISQGSPTGVDLVVKDGPTVGGANLSAITSINGGFVGNQGGRLVHPITGTSGTLTGTRTISLCVIKWAGGPGDGWQHGGSAYTNVTALLTAA